MTGPVPPVAALLPVTTSVHGDTLTDEYAWLRNREDPAVRALLEAENAWAESTLAPTMALQEELYQEMLSRIQQTEASAPWPDRGYRYWSRTVEGLQYPIHCRAREPEGPEEILLDLNALAEGKPYLALGAFSVSDDGRYLAYSLDETGFRQYRLQVKDLETGRVLDGAIERTGSVAWSRDGHTLLYTVEDETKRQYRLYRVSLTDTRTGLGPSALEHEESDAAFSVAVHRTRSRRLMLMTLGSHTTSEVHWRDASLAGDPWRVVLPRVPDREYEVGDHGDDLLIRINDTGRNFRLVRAPIADPSPSSWSEVLAHDPAVMLEGVGCFAGHLVVWDRREGLPGIRILEPDGSERRRLTFPEAVYEVDSGPNCRWDTTALRFVYQSPVTPPSTFDEDVVSGERILRKQTRVLGDFRPDRYRTERILAPAIDGTRIPVSLILPASAPEGPLPLLVHGYGAYGISYPVSFSTTRLSLLDRGIGVAIAHVRGGGELGKGWHDAGRMAAKATTFTDFLAVLGHLVETGRSTRDQLVIEGGSAGGLLIGAVLNRDPRCCRAAILQVPFVDVLNTMRDPGLPLTVGEYEEWGDPAVEEEYRWMRSYCPYTNLGATDYPALLVRTSFHDSQVMYWEPAKYVSRLRVRRTNTEPVLLVTNLGAGHGGASGRYDRLREIALDQAFVLWVLGRAGTGSGDGREPRSMDDTRGPSRGA